MIRPDCFGFNNETAASNAFQQSGATDVPQQALKEFDAAVDSLISKGMQVIVVNDAPIPLPDSVFPNNWFTTHHDGTLIIYPMQSEIRRKEKRLDIFQKILPAEGFQVHSIHDLSEFEKKDQYLEGTGSMVMDHRHRILFACRSPRTFEQPLKQVSELLGYRYLLFDAKLNGKDIYHTNVMMSIGNGLAVICTDVLDEPNRKKVIPALSAAGELLFISVQQLNCMAGNMLMTVNHKNEQLCILSETAFRSLLPRQIKQLEQWAIPVVCRIPVIEKTGGGSIRCMLAEIFLPRSARQS
jgi:hypothetical protein